MTFKKLLLAQLVAIASISGTATADFPDRFLTFRGTASAYEACLDAGFDGVNCERWEMPDGDVHDKALVCECVENEDQDRSDTK